MTKKTIFMDFICKAYIGLSYPALNCAEVCRDPRRIHPMAKQIRRSAEPFDNIMLILEVFGRRQLAWFYSVVEFRQIHHIGYQWI